MIILIIKILYLLLPGFIGNVSAELSSKINFLNIRVDFGKKLNNKPIFGSHKTWRGIFFSSLFGILIFVIQKLIGINSLINYSDYNWLQAILFGFLLGFGTIVGDLIKSFFKRRVNIKSGKPWFPFDQIDLVIGMYVFILPFYVMSWQNFFITILVVFILHILFNIIGYLLKIRKEMF